MNIINATEYADVIEHIACRLNQSVCIWGGSGAGKTQIAGQVAKKLGAYHCDFRLGQYDSIDLRGMPEGQDGMTVWNMPSTLPFVGNPKFDGYEDRYILVTLDEIDHANQAVKGVAYQLVLERRIGEHILRPNVRIMAMRNRAKDKGVSGGRDPEPLNRRFTHFEMQPTKEAFCDYITSSCMTPNQQGNVIGPSAAADGVAFMLWRGNECLDAYDPLKPSICVASSRTWETALVYHGDTKLSASLRQAAIAGSIGDFWATEFDTFIALKDKVIPIAKIIADPLGVELPEEPSLQYATVVSVSGGMSLKNMSPLYRFVKRFDPEFVILCLQLAMKRDPSLVEAPEFLDFAKNFKAVFSSK